MLGYLIYDKKDSILTSIGETFEVQREVKIDLTQFDEFLIASNFAKSKYDYDPLILSILRNSPYYDELKKCSEQTKNDSSVFLSCEIGEDTNNNIYFSDGEIWNWDFEFIVK